MVSTPKKHKVFSESIKISRLVKDGGKLLDVQGKVLKADFAMCKIHCIVHNSPEQATRNSKRNTITSWNQLNGFLSIEGLQWRTMQVNF